MSTFTASAYTRAFITFPGSLIPVEDPTVLIQVASDLYCCDASDLGISPRPNLFPAFLHVENARGGKVLYHTATKCNADGEPESFTFANGATRVEVFND